MVTLCDPSLNWFKNAFGLISLDLPILNLKWEKVMRCPRFPSGRSFSRDYGSWKSHIILKLINSFLLLLKFISIVSLHIWWQQQVEVG